MDDLRTRLQERSARFQPSRDAYGRVRTRVARRRAHRRVASGAVAIAISAAALGGLWSATRPESPPLQSLTPTPAPSRPPGDLRIALNAKVGGWIPLDDGFNVWVAGPGTLAIVDRRTGEADVVARGDWDYDYTNLFAYAEGTILLAYGSSIWEIFGPGDVRRLDLGLGNIYAVHQMGVDTWVAAIRPSGGVLAQVDLDTGRILRTFPLGQGVYQLASTGRYLFIGTRDPGPSLFRLDVSNGTMDRVPHADGMTIATTTGRLWWASPGSIHCVDAEVLTPCGDVQIRDPVLLAGDEDKLWVLSATGSTSSTIYEPDPDVPAQVTEFDGAAGEAVAGPIDLPDFTPARMSVFHGRAWIGFHDSGRLILVQECPSDGCRLGKEETLRGDSPS